MRFNDGRTWLEYFAAELRSWREYRKMSQLQLAKAINYSESAVGMVETARRKPKVDFVKRCDDALETGGALRRLLKELVERELIPDWLDRWRIVEEQATALNSFEALVVPGLLQTPDYARAVFERSGQPASQDIEAQVRTRIERQQILERDDPPMFVAVVDEGVLHRAVGGPEVMCAQLLHLVELCESRSDIVVQVIPKDVGAYAGLAGPFAIATMDGDEFVYLDTALYGQLAESAHDLAIVKRMWETLRAEALPRQASINLIKKVAEQWK
ncbi:helix-turn-helix transcriptional regulator [Actinoallomurus sp. NPDC052308]|uniref:helix-turn-helix domain-containing protein n=1 Tax=Actinoallomurus sp. NPDC052308 TaxID=3155530 RepID=UPI00341F05E4